MLHIIKFISNAQNLIKSGLLSGFSNKVMLYIQNIYNIKRYSHIVVVEVYYFLVWIIHFNDPSAGSPTETLLRLHLPLNDKVRTSSRSQAPMKEPNHSPESSPDHSIGRCDGRCVQRAGT